MLTELDGKTLPFARRFQSALLRFQPRHTEEVVAPCEKEAPELAELRRKTSEAPESWGNGLFGVENGRPRAENEGKPWSFIVFHAFS